MMMVMPAVVMPPVMVMSLSRRRCFAARLAGGRGFSSLRLRVRGLRWCGRRRRCLAHHRHFPAVCGLRGSDDLRLNLGRGARLRRQRGLLRSLGSSAAAHSERE
jgi:hypothetical protein